MFKINFLITIIFLTLVIFISNGKCNGQLFIIGGGDCPAYMMKKFVVMSGGEKGNIAIIPLASSVPLETALFQKYEFEKLGAGKVDFAIFTHETADADSNISLLNNATSVFFSGGDQSRLTKVLLNTKMLQRIKEIYKNGGVIGGTSAGAAVMSEIMITGDELLNKDSTRSFISIQKNNIKTTPGFGFITSAIIDQHFITRKRHNRLISLVIEHPNLLGVGIDESTAIIVSPDNTFQVFGEQTIMVLDANNAKSISVNKKNDLSATDIKMHILKSGQKFNLITREIFE